MRRNPAITVGLLVAIAGATVWCFSIVIGRRFASGEVYPPCSTQRADPMGAKALYEALDRLGGTTCERNFKRLGKLSDVTGTAESLVSASRWGHTLVLLDVPPWAFTGGDELDGGVVRDFAVAGGRVVITVNGNAGGFEKLRQSAEERQRELREERRKKKDDAKKGEPGDKSKTKEWGPGDRTAKKRPDDKPEKLPFKPAKSLVEAIQIDVTRGSLSAMPLGGHTLETPEGISAIGGPLPHWLSRASLDLNSKKKDKGDAKSEGIEKAAADAPEEKDKSESAARKPWRVLATVEGKPVLAERRFGNGSIVVATDSYFATNQALLMHPVPEFLAWLIGDARKVIFDETHLGTQENPGIMTLARRYRLHGFFLGGLLLFALFVWQSSSSLVPAQDGAESGARAVAGQGAVTGLISLLRRGVSRSRLLETCFDQWVRNHPHPNSALQGRIEQARALLPPPGKRPSRGDLVLLYQRLCETLHPKRR